MSSEILDKEDFINLIKAVVYSILGILLFISITGNIFHDQVVKIKFSLWYPILATFTATLFFIVLYIRAKTVDIRRLMYLLIFSFLLILFNLFQLLDWETAVNNPPFNRPLNHPLLNIADLFIPLLLLSLYFYFSSIAKRRIKPWILSLLGLSIFPMIILNILVIVGQDKSVNDTIFMLVPLLGIALIFIALYGLRIMTRIYFNTKDKKVKSGALVMMTSYLLLTLAFTTQILTGDSVNFGFFEAEIFQLLLFIIGTAMLSYTYIRNPHLLYPIPFDVYELMIYDSSGEPILYHSFASNSGGNQQMELRSKGLHALGNILREISGFRGRVKGVQLTDGCLIIESNSEYSVCLITEVRSPQIIGATRNFFSEFTSKYTDNIEINKEEIIACIQRYFPY